MNNQNWIPVSKQLPPSGKEVLLYCESERNVMGEYICVGFYAKAKTIPVSTYETCCDYDYDEEKDNFYLCEGFYEYIKNWEDYESVVINDIVTNWMLLPESPEEDNI